MANHVRQHSGHTSTSSPHGIGQSLGMDMAHPASDMVKAAPVGNPAVPATRNPLQPVRAPLRYPR
eukprot:4501570-Pyramimonas_sp.AAC.1